jgi:glycosyltransferase involved in cell wall biosynthesis
VHSDPWIEAIHNKSSIKKIKTIKEFVKTYKDKKIITVSKGIKETLVSKFKTNPSNVTVIYNPFDFEEILKKSIEFDVDFDYVVHVGRFHPQKRHDILFESFKKMNTDLKLVLLCHESEELKNLIENYALKDRVVVIGFKQNPYPYIKKAKLLILTSDYEGLPTVLIEALSLNVPVVSTNCPTGPREILKDDLSQFLCKYQDTDDIAEKANLALQNYPDIKTIHIDKFSFNAYVKLLEALSKKP